MGKAKTIHFVFTLTAEADIVDRILEVVGDASWPSESLTALGDGLWETAASSCYLGDDGEIEDDDTDLYERITDWDIHESLSFTGSFNSLELQYKGKDFR